MHFFTAAEFPQIKEDNYYNNGNYRVDKSGSETMLNCLMYKLVYYRYGEIKTKSKEEKGYDSVRKTVIGNTGYKLKHFEEAYTSDRWLVRIFKVLDPPEMDPKMETRNAKSNSLLPNLPKMRMPNF
jgi:dolichyl-diphosphooligosaccharide---protein glycosyltransferase